MVGPIKDGTPFTSLGYDVTNSKYRDFMNAVDKKDFTKAGQLLNQLLEVRYTGTKGSDYDPDLNLIVNVDIQGTIIDPDWKPTELAKLLLSTAKADKKDGPYKVAFALNVISKSDKAQFTKVIDIMKQYDVKVLNPQEKVYEAIMTEFNKIINDKPKKYEVPSVDDPTTKWSE